MLVSLALPSQPAPSASAPARALLALLFRAFHLRAVCSQVSFPSRLSHAPPIIFSLPLLISFVLLLQQPWPLPTSLPPLWLSLSQLFQSPTSLPVLLPASSVSPLLLLPVPTVSLVLFPLLSISLLQFFGLPRVLLFAVGESAVPPRLSSTSPKCRSRQFPFAKRSPPESSSANSVRFFQRFAFALLLWRADRVSLFLFDIILGGVAGFSTLPFHLQSVPARPSAF